MFGLLNLYKPAGITSRDAVNRVQRLVRPAKVGHAGTLDPLADGVLLVTLGAATRLTEYLQRLPKRYRATFLLGRSSDTEDIQGHGGAAAASAPAVGSRSAADLAPFSGPDPPATPRVFGAEGRRAASLSSGPRRTESRPGTQNRARSTELQIEHYAYPQLILQIRLRSRHLRPRTGSGSGPGPGQRGRAGRSHADGHRSAHGRAGRASGSTRSSDTAWLAAVPPDRAGRLAARGTHRRRTAAGGPGPEHRAARLRSAGIAGPQPLWPIVGDAGASRSGGSLRTETKLRRP